MAVYRCLLEILNRQTGSSFKLERKLSSGPAEKVSIIPPRRVRYLSEIAEGVRSYNQWAEEQANLAETIQALDHSASELDDRATQDALTQAREAKAQKLDAGAATLLQAWPEKVARYQAEEYAFQVRDKEIRIPTHSTSLAHSRIPKIALPRYRSHGDILRWNLQENVPGEFPFTAGVFPFRREGEDPTRMFAGEGGPERTNRRFHYVSQGMPAIRLSTAFDSVTLYGEDPDQRPDIYGKIGNSGVSICCLDDAKKLYSGFNLCDPKCSVSMTINGPAPMMLSFFYERRHRPTVRDLHSRAGFGKRSQCQNRENLRPARH